MSSNQLREAFLHFFEERGHIIVPSSSLLTKDPTVLFTTAGMQQFKPYFLGEKSPFGEKTASCQKCFRTSDIDEVGDESHLTFFEMLGNFSFGDYFKKEAILQSKEFIEKNLGLKIDYVSVFDPDRVEQGDWRKEIPFDKESFQVWQDIAGLPVSKIKKEGTDNFWGPTGKEGPCGPTTEIYSKSKGGKSIEVWNLVFNEYFADSQKNLSPLKSNGVDTGMGLERLAALAQEKATIFETDLFYPIVETIEKLSNVSYKDFSEKRFFRIVADHMKGAVFLTSEGLVPLNVEQGYVLRKLIRRAIRWGKILQIPLDISPLLNSVIDIYKKVYPELEQGRDKIIAAIQDEVLRFSKTLEQGLSELRRIAKEKEEGAEKLGQKLFFIYQSYGFPLELSLEEFEMLRKKPINFKNEVARYFEQEFRAHQEKSRAGAEKKFGGHGLALNTGELKAASPDQIDKVIKLHTATHLLNKALRIVLGEEVKQMGSDITDQRTRFDFSFSRKLTRQELAQIEELVNLKIKEDLPVASVEMKKEEAEKSGALHFFAEKYPEIVKVYYIGNDLKTAFSKEFCGGPHVKRTSEIGKFKILKENSSGAGVRRIRAIIE